jgi:hypothetical protein
MKRNALNLPHGIGGRMQFMGFVDSKFNLNIQPINANLILVHHQPHGLVSEMFLKLWKLEQCLVYLLLTFSW